MKTLLSSLLAFAALHILTAQNQKPDYELGGFLEFDHISYFENQNGNINSRNQSVLQLEFEIPFHTRNMFFTSVEFREDFSDPTRRRIFMKENYVKMPFKNLDLQIGKQIITWGKTDGINPTNNFNPTDYSDLFDTQDETIGLLAINTVFYLNTWSFQAVFSPIHQPDVLPVNNNSRWNNNVFALIARDYQLSNYQPEYLPAKTPDNNLKGAQYGFNIANSVGGIDFEINYYNGYNHIPTIYKLNLQPADTFTIQLQNTYNHRHITGFSMATALSGFGLRAEAAYFFPGDILLDKQYMQYVIGIDRNISNVLGTNNLFILAQWIDELTHDNIEYAYYDFNHLFPKTAMLRAEMELGYSGIIAVQGLYNTNNNSYYIQPEFEYNLSPGLKLNLRCDIFQGTENSFFGMFNDNDRIQVRLTYNW